MTSKATVYDQSDRPVNAMQDAITLASWFHVLPPTTIVADIKKVIEEYQQERHPLAVKAFEAS